MKRFSITILVTLLFIVNSYAANFYWLAIRYDNNWFDGRNWSHTQGGAAVGNVCGGCVGIDYPGSTDDVFIDASTSGQVSYASQGIQMRSMTWFGTANATSELYGYGSMLVSGSVVFVSNMKINASYITLYGSGGSDVFTTAANDMKDCNVAIVSGTYALTGDYSSSTTLGKISVGGTFSTNNFNISVNNVSASNASTIVFNMGSSVFTCVDFNMNYSPGSQTLTINPGTSTINYINLFYGGNKTFYSVVKVANSGVQDACLAGNFTNLTIKPGVNCSFSGGTSTTISNSLTVVGTAANRIALSNYGSGTFTLIDPNGSAMAYVDIVNGIAQNNGSAFEFTTTNSTKTNCHGWDRVATPITFGGATKTYGASSFSMTASSTSTGAFTYSIISGSSFASINASTGAVTILGAGAVTVQATQAGDMDHLPNSTTTSLTISKASLTATTNAKSRIYGAANPTFDFTYSGFVNGETAAVLTAAPTGSCTAVATSGVGAYGIVGSGGSASNYSFTYSNAGSLSITPAPIVVTVNDASKAYGSANPTFGYSYSGFVNGDNASAFVLAFSSPTTSATTGSGVGTYAINAAGGNVGPNYSVVVTGGAVNSGTLTITKTLLTATAANASRLYGSSNPVLTVNYSGFVNGETATVLTTQSTATTSAIATSPVGSYSIIPSGGSATNYSFTYANGSLSITQAPLTATTNAKSRIYGAANPTFDFTYSGFVNGETATVLTAAPTGSCTAVATSGVGAYGIVGSGGSASNYSFTYSNAGSLSITPAPIVVTVNDASKAYGSANPTFSYSYSGFVNGDNASAFVLAFSSPTTSATTGSGVGTYAINAAGGNVGPNYSVVATGGSVNSGTLTITKTLLTATAANASRLYGSSNPVLTVNYSGFVNGETASVLTTQSTATTSAIATSPVGSYSIIPSGGSATNYSFTYANGSLSITQAPLTATTNAKSRIYGAANPTFDFTYSGFVNGETATVLTAAPTGSCTAVATSGVGAYGIVGSGGSASNYSFTYSNAGSLSITPAPIVVTVNDVSKAYGSANPTFGYSYSGFVNGDNASAFVLAFSSPTTSATTGSGVGTYAINAAGGNVGPNYSVVATGGSVNSGTLTITKTLLTATAANASRLYGSSNPVLTVNYSGFVNGETATVLTTQSTATTSAIATSPVGSYSIIPSGGSATNYSFTYVNGSLSITQTLLTVTANNKSRAYGAANPTFDFTYSGFVNGETASVIAAQPTATTSAVTTSQVGSYSIIPSGGSATNYLFTYVNGSLSITQVPLTVTANNKSRAYGAANPTFDFTYSGFVNGETATVLTTAPTASTSAIATSGVGSYSIVPSGGSATNYSFAYANGSLSITQVPLTVTANNKSRVYGAANPTFDFAYSGFVNGETASVITTQPTATTSAVTTSLVGSYSIIPSGGSATNYSFTYANGSLLITQALLTVTVNDVARAYGDANPTFSFSYSGFVNGDDASVFTSPPMAVTTATVQSNTGTYSITASGGAAANYSFGTYQPGTLTITKANQAIIFGALAPISVTSAPITLTALSNSGLSVTYSSSNASVATISGNTITIVGIGTSTITASQAGDTNYNAALPVDRTLTVNNLLSQTITFGALAPVTFGSAPFTLNAVSSNSTIPVSYLSSNPLVATVNGNTVTVVAAGTAIITASQAGDVNYNAATDVGQTFIVNQADQTITFGVLTPVIFGATPFTLSATSSSGLPVSYSSSNTSVAAVSGNTITIVGAGTTTITASQAGNINYNAAPNVDEALTVKLSQTITFNPIQAIAVTHAPFDLNTYASSNASLALTYSSSDLTVATVSGSTITIVGTGTTTITASQAGNGTYAPATSVQHDLTVFSKVLGFVGASVVQDTLVFGNVVVGLTSTLKFTLTNSGTAALSISSIAYPSGFSGDKANGTISVGGTLDVNVTYTPSTLLAIKEAIVFASDATSGLGQLFVTGVGTKITGVEESPSQFSVYPNPSNGLFTLEGIDNDQQNLPLEIVDAAGRSMGYFPLSNIGESKFQLDITTASDGLYLLRIQGKKAVRIIKK